MRSDNSASTNPGESWQNNNLDSNYPSATVRRFRFRAVPTRCSRAAAQAEGPARENIFSSPTSQMLLALVLHTPAVTQLQCGAHLNNCLSESRVAAPTDPLHTNEVPSDASAGRPGMQLLFRRRTAACGLVSPRRRTTHGMSKPG